MDEQQDNQQPNSIDDLQKDLTEAIAAAEKNLDGWKRTAADFENYKRRSELEKKELLEFAKEVTVVKLLPTIDTLEQALRHLPQYSVDSAQLSVQGTEHRAQSTDFEKQYQNWQIGVSGIVAQLDKVLEDLGVKKIEAKGKKFDPHFHEAVRKLESEADDGIVVDELQTGFELNGRVIRPSQVIISKKK
jgi:molecular chaperone GrpE